MLPTGKLYVPPTPSLIWLLIAALSKPPTQTSTQKTLQKLILSHFHNIIHILSQLTDTEMLQLALGESAKILPYVVGSRKAIKGYLKVHFQILLWSS